MLTAAAPFYTLTQPECKGSLTDCPHQNFFLVLLVTATLTRERWNAREGLIWHQQFKKFSWCLKGTAKIENPLV